MASSPFTRLPGNLGGNIKDFFIHSYSVKSVPLRIRPAIIVVLASWILILGVLGLARIPEVPVNDKILHFFGMGIATFLLYFVIDVPDSSRRIWYYRRAPMILTLSVGFLGGGILSEIAQGYLPWKTFQWGDIMANLAGCSLAYFLAHTLLQRHRRRFEISRLYLPISSNGPDVENMPSFNARSAYMQNGQRDRSASVDTELGAWDADRYYYAGQTSGMGDSGMGENAPYDTLDSPPAGVTHGKTTRADDGERSNVFDLGDDEEEDTTLSGGQRE